MKERTKQFFNKAYRDKQLARNLGVLDKIVRREPVSSGRVIPAAEDISIYDGRQIDATVMFLDISRFSQRPGWTIQEQEQLLRILSLFFTEMIRIVEDFGGEVEKNTGDGLMAYFVKGTQDAVSAQQRAVEAAITMFYAADNFINPILARSGIDKVRFRVCMDHGPITVAKVGLARGFNGIVAIGTTANIASKMLSSAEPNSILIGEKVVIGLPEEWRNRWVRFKTSDTGWYHRESGSSYSYWEYVGRWLEPIL